MTKSNVTNYLSLENKNLNTLLVKLNQLTQWNSWLKDCLPDEPNLLQHCQIVGLDKSSLIVIAENSHWVTRFRFYIPKLITLLRAYEGLQGINSICCKVRPPFIPQSSLKRKSRRMKLSVENAKNLINIANKVNHEKLKMLLMKIAAHSKTMTE